MEKEIKNGWSLDYYGGVFIRLHDAKSPVSHKEHTGSTTVSKYYNVHVNKDNEIIVSGAIRKSFPRLPKYVKEGIIEFVKEVHGDRDYTMLND